MMPVMNSLVVIIIILFLAFVDHIVVDRDRMEYDQC